MKRVGPRVVATVAGLLWGGGVFSCQFFRAQAWWLYLTYGVIGGTGLGMGYIVPITSGEVVSRSPGIHHGIAVADSGRITILSARRRMADATCGIMPTFAYPESRTGSSAVARARSCKIRRKVGRRKLDSVRKHIRSDVSAISPGRSIEHVAVGGRFAC